MERKLDLTISGSRLWLRTRDCLEDELLMGPGNQAQGLRWENGLAVMDPLSDEDFGADVIIRTPERFSPDKRAQRRLKIPLHIAADANLALGSPAEEIGLDMPLAAGDYTLIFEVCVGRDVFYTLSLLAQPLTEASSMLADGWGLKKDQALRAGLL